MGFCGCASVSFVVVRSDLWASGAMVLWFVVGRRPLWICGGHSVGLWRCGCGFGIVEMGCAVGLLQTKEKKSPERKRRTNREMNNKNI